MQDKIDKVLSVMKSLAGLNNFIVLSENDKEEIMRMELEHNLGVFECLKRDCTILFTHDSRFREPPEPVVSIFNERAIFPPVAFPEVKEKDTVSSSPSWNVHQFLVEKFGLKLNEDEATLLLGFNY